MALLKTDMWRSAIIDAPVETILKNGSLEGLRCVWLPDTGAWTFLADPFGIWKDGLLYVFVEAYDYRDRRGRIDVCIYDEQLALREHRSVLKEPWHLSYPVVIEHDGEIWMLPEAYRSGRLTMYRAKQFPWEWEAVDAFSFPVPGIDASPVFYQDRWWIFFTPPGSAREKKSILHAAWSDSLTGQWTMHDANPIWTDISGARAGGTPVVIDGRLLLPTQDCTTTYGGAIQFLMIDSLSPDSFSATREQRLQPTPAASPYLDGLHTFSQAGHVTLIDAKKISRSPGRLVLDLKRRTGHAAPTILTP